VIAVRGVAAYFGNGRAQVEEVEEDFRVGPAGGLTDADCRAVQLTAGGGLDDDALGLGGGGDHRGGGRESDSGSGSDEHDMDGAADDADGQAIELLVSGEVNEPREGRGCGRALRRLRAPPVPLSSSTHRQLLREALDEGEVRRVSFERMFDRLLSPARAARFKTCWVTSACVRTRRADLIHEAGNAESSGRRQSGRAPR